MLPLYHEIFFLFNFFCFETLSQEKLINGEDSLCIDPLNDENFFLDNQFGSTSAAPELRADPPAIQVDRPSGVIGDRRIPNRHPNLFFYLSTLPMAIPPVLVLRIIEHKWFGLFPFNFFYSNAVSRASIVSAGGSSMEFNRSRASSNASNVPFDVANLKRNINLHCSNISLSPSRLDIERRASIKSEFYICFELSAPSLTSFLM